MPVPYCHKWLCQERIWDHNNPQQLNVYRTRESISGSINSATPNSSINGLNIHSSAYGILFHSTLPLNLSAVSPGRQLPTLNNWLWFSSPMNMSRCSWFLSFQTWQISCQPPQIQESASCYEDAGIRGIARELMDKWLRQWVSQGQTTFIHNQLYGHGNNIPRCI